MDSDKNPASFFTIELLSFWQDQSFDFQIPSSRIPLQISLCQINRIRLPSLRIPLTFTCGNVTQV